MQLPFLFDSIWPLIIGLIISIAVVGLYVSWTIRIRNKAAAYLDVLLTFRMSVSILELSETLDKRPIDRQTVFSVVEHTPSAILTFSKTTVVSRVILLDRLKEMLVNNFIVRTEKVSIQWDITTPVIGTMVWEISNRDGLDVLQTKSGDFLLVPELKGRLRDAIDLQGRVNINDEAQRLHVDTDDLLLLVRSWGWSLFEGTDGTLVSLRWLRSTIELNVEKTGHLDSTVESQRLALNVEDIIRAVATFGWDLQETTDNRLVPRHLIEEQLITRIENQGYLEQNNIESEFKIPVETALQMIRKRKSSTVMSNERELFTLGYLKQKISDDIVLSKIFNPREFSSEMGIKLSTVVRIIQSLPDFRKVRDSNYISIEVFRRWLLDQVVEDGLVPVHEVETSWGLSNLSLTMLMKRFGLQTVQTEAGDYLSLAWIRRKIRAMIIAGTKIESPSLAKQYGINVRVAESILSNIETDALFDIDGSLVPISVLQKELSTVLETKGILDPQKIASERGIDVSEIEKLAENLQDGTIVSSTGVIIRISSVIDRIRAELGESGLFDLKIAVQNYRVDYVTIAKELEKNLKQNEYIIDACGVIVASSWIDFLREAAAEKGHIRVTEFARERHLRHSVALCMIRRLLRGTYLSSSDTFFVRV